MDRFDEMAIETLRHTGCVASDEPPGRCWECEQVAAALRDTDAKAREDCAKRCDKRAAKHIQESVRVKRLPERTPLREVMRLERVAAEAQACAAAIREGAGECLCHETTVGKTCPLHDVESMARGAGECGKPGQPHICADECGTCGTCGSVGTIRVHDPEDCSLYEDPVTRSHFDEYGKCNRCYPQRVPCPACQGGDDAE